MSDSNDDKPGRGTAKPSVAGRQFPSARVPGGPPPTGPQAEADKAPEVGKDVDCVLPDSDIVRDITPDDARSP